MFRSVINICLLDLTFQYNTEILTFNYNWNSLLSNIKIPMSVDSYLNFHIIKH